MGARPLHRSLLIRPESVHAWRLSIQGLANFYDRVPYGPHALCRRKELHDLSTGRSTTNQGCSPAVLQAWGGLQTAVSYRSTSCKLLHCTCISKWCLSTEVQLQHCCKLAAFVTTVRPGKQGYFIGRQNAQKTMSSRSAHFSDKMCDPCCHEEAANLSRLFQLCGGHDDMQGAACAHLLMSHVCDRLIVKGHECVSRREHALQQTALPLQPVVLGRHKRQVCKAAEGCNHTCKPQTLESIARVCASKVEAAAIQP